MTSAGYWPSTWPVECGGNHRPNAAPGPGLKLGPTDRLVTTTRQTGRWPAMFVQRDQGQLYLAGTSNGGSEPAGWVERVDPVTLRPLEHSGDLSTGGHEWCGSLAVHRNGDLYSVNGSFLHRLSPDCAVVAKRRLPIDRAHNGLLSLHDGSIITKDIAIEGAPSTLTILDPDLEILGTTTLPEPSMGRLSAVTDRSATPSPTDTRADGRADEQADLIYVPGTTRIFRYRWDGRDLVADDTWQPVYRTPDRGGPAWDTTIADSRIWFHDNGSTNDIKRRFGGPADDPRAGPSEAAARWGEPVRLLGVDLTSADDMTIIHPTELPSGWVIAPPLVAPGLVIGWDTGNTGLAAFDISPGADGEMLWFQPFRSSMQPLLYPESGELITNDFRYLDDGSTSDDLVVIDVATGRMKARAATGATSYSGMFLTPGWGRDLYYCSFETVARVEARSL